MIDPNTAALTILAFATAVKTVTEYLRSKKNEQKLNQIKDVGDKSEKKLNDIKDVSDNIHTMSNGRYVDQLRLNVVTLEALVIALKRLSGNKDLQDVVAYETALGELERAERNLINYLSVQSGLKKLSHD
jgi:hypothetical protein